MKYFNSWQSVERRVDAPYEALEYMEKTYADAQTAMDFVRFLLYENPNQLQYADPLLKEFAQACADARAFEIATWMDATEGMNVRLGVFCYMEKRYRNAQTGLNSVKYLIAHPNDLAKANPLLQEFVQLYIEAHPN